MIAFFIGGIPMSTFDEKLKTLLHNYEMTQKDLAERINVSPSTVSKWCSGDNNPSIDTIKDLSKIFYVPCEVLIEDIYEVPTYFYIDKYVPYSKVGNGDSPHTVIDAALEGNARLHRFTNRVGDACSAIYVAHEERWWHYRNHEAKMIWEWNDYHKDKGML